MQDDRRTEDSLNDFASRLSALVPNAQLDRDQLMFAAGRRAGARQLRVFQGGLALSCATCLALAALLVTQAGREPQMAESLKTGPGGRVQEFATASNPAETGAPRAERFVPKTGVGWKSGDMLGDLRQSPDLLLALDRRSAAGADSNSPTRELTEPNPAGSNPTGLSKSQADSDSSVRALLNRYLHESPL